MLQHLIYFSLHYLSSGHLQEIKDKDKFQTYNSQSGRSRLWEVVAYKRFHI